MSGRDDVSVAIEPASLDHEVSTIGVALVVLAVIGMIVLAGIAHLAENAREHEMVLPR
jgi:hypothetical protein